MTDGRVPGSFRDPAGYLYRRDGVLHRQVNTSFADTYDAVVERGLYDALWEAGLLVEHEVVDLSLADDPDTAHVVLRPDEVGFVSQPHEWSPAQRRDAAIATIEAQRIALRHDCILRDAPAHNVALRGGRAVLIDTLSFAPWTVGEPWQAYGQFCRHFLAPLALETIVDHRLRRLLFADVDGIPLDLASTLLPTRTKFRPGLLTHLHAHASASGRGEADPDAAPKRSVEFSERAMLGLVNQLHGLVSKLTWDDVTTTTWAEYDEQLDHYGGTALDAKQTAVTSFVEQVAPATVWDLGANTGRFSRLAAATGADVVAWDIDEGAVERSWRSLAEQPLDTGDVVPLILDLANPSPGLGWAHTERPSMVDRAGDGVDLVLALALIHHLAIGNNVPLPRVVDLLLDVGRHVVVEWVPKDDVKVRTLLATREDVFDTYTRETLESALVARAEILETVELPDSGRVLFLARRR